MAEEKTPQAKADDKRREHHYQVRLDPLTSAKLKHFMASRDYSSNEALRIIISKFFN
jgi:hypothetical protein